MFNDIELFQTKIKADMQMQMCMRKLFFIIKQKNKKYVNLRVNYKSKSTIYTVK